MKHLRIHRLILAAISVCPLSSAAIGEEVKSNFLAEGVTQKVGGYRPVRAEMEEESDLAKKIPEDFSAPKYGTIKFGDQQWSFVLDQPEEGEQRLMVDTNGDGDLTNDPVASWELKPSKMYSGEAQIDLGNNRLGKVMMYRFDPKDERRAQLKNTVLYYSDFGFEFQFDLDGQSLSTFVAGSLSDGARLPIDRDGNGRVSPRFESATVGEPFNFTGTTYVFSIEKDGLKLDVADEKLPQLPMPPDLRLGKQSLAFSAKSMEGEEIDFPKAYAGKVVMLDFWATWCGPCIGEIPNMKQAYADWHDKGFEILGISFDFEDKEEVVKEFLKDKELPWSQIYEGKGWETSLGIQHDVSGIPFVLLVDGDTGTIIGTSKELRGEKLTEYIGEQLEKKAAK